MKQLDREAHRAAPYWSAAIPLTLLVVLIGTRFGGLFSLAPSNISAFWPVNAVLFASAFVMSGRQRTLTLLLALPTYVVAELWTATPA